MQTVPKISSQKLRLYIPILISFLLLGAAFSQSGLSDVASQLSQISVGHVALMFLASFLNLLIVSGRLIRLLRFLGYLIPARQIVLANIAGLASSLFVVSLVGSIVGRHLILRRSGVSAAANAFIVAYERVILVVVGGTFFCVGAIVIFGQDAVRGIAYQLPLTYFAVAFVGALLLTLILSRNRIEHSFLRGALSARSAIQFVELFGITATAQVFTFLVYVVSAMAFAPDTPLPMLFAAAAVIAFASSFPLSVNGWGIREVTAIYVLGSLGVSAANALTISVSVGLVSTLTVLAAGFGATALNARGVWKRRQESPEEPASEPETASSSPFAADRALKAMALVLPLSAGILLFFQAGVTWNGGLISINLADPIAIVGLALVMLIALSDRAHFIRFSPMTWFWIVSCTAAIALAFVIGWSRFGITPWALNNRLIGWVVLLGYTALGGLLVSIWAQYGLRRLGEALISTAAAVTVISLIMMFVHHVFGIDTLIEGNFQGFSFNRNGFAFQLNIALCFALAFAPFRWRAADWRNPRVFVWSILTGLILYGIWQAQSRTGIAVAFGLIGLALTFRTTSFRAVASALACTLALYLSIHIATLALGNFSPSVSELSRLATAPEHFNPESVTERWASLVDSIAIWFDNLVFGAGLGAYMHGHISDGSKPLVIHSVPGWLLAEFGILGTGVILLAPLLGFAGLLRQVFKRRYGVNPAPGLLMLLAAAFCVFGLTHDIAYQRIFWLSIGAVLASHYLYRNRTGRRIPKNPLRVMHVITSLNRGGAETMLTNLTRTAKNAGRDHAVVSLVSDSALADEVRAAGVPVTELGFTQSYPNPIGILRLAREIRRFKPDVVQGWMYHGDLIASVALYLSGRRRVTKLVWGIRCSDMNYDRYSWTLRAVVSVCKRLSRLPDMVIANSEVGRNFHRTLGYRPNRFGMVANGIDVGRFQPNLDRRNDLRAQFGIPQDARVAVCVARVDTMKDHEGLMRAAAQVPGLWLVLVGKDTIKALPEQDRTVRYGISDNVPDVLNVADAIVLGSRFGEGFSNALAEGMAASLYPIATDVGDSRVIVEGVGAVVPPSSTEDMVGALREFVEMDETELARKKAAAHDRIKTRYTLRKALQAFEDHYIQLYQTRSAETVPAR